MEQSASSTRHGPGRRPRVMVGLSFDPPPGLLSWARTEAVRRGADLELVHVPPPRNQQGRETYLRDPSDADWRDEHSFGRQWVEEMAAAVRPRLAEHDLRVTVTVLGGNPGPVLRRMTRRADLMVLGRRAVTSGGGGGGGGRRVGPLSVIAQVLVAPECDVLLVPEEAGLRTAERDPVPALVSAVQGAMTPGGHPVDDDVLHRLAGVQRVDGRPPLVTVPAGAVGAWSDAGNSALTPTGRAFLAQTPWPVLLRTSHERPRTPDLGDGPRDHTGPGELDDPDEPDPAGSLAR